MLRFVFNIISIGQKTARANSKWKEIPKNSLLNLKLFCLDKIFLKFGNEIKSTDSKALLQSNHVDRRWGKAVYP